MSEDPTSTSIPDSGSIGFDVPRRDTPTIGAPSIAASGCAIATETEESRTDVDASGDTAAVIGSSAIARMAVFIISFRVPRMFNSSTARSCSEASRGMPREIIVDYRFPLTVERSVARRLPLRGKSFPLSRAVELSVVSGRDSLTNVNVSNC